MKAKSRSTLKIFAAGYVWFCIGVVFVAMPLARAQTKPQDKDVKRSSFNQEGPKMKNHASGSFEVKLTPVPSENKAEGAAIARMIIDKKFSGDLNATSKGEMLSAGGSVKGSAGYVAMEVVTGTLQGRSGTFVLQHTGTMTRGEPQLTITVVPDSGTSELTGIAGTLTIKITEGKHFYEFDYTLPETH